MEPTYALTRLVTLRLKGRVEMRFTLDNEMYGSGLGDGRPYMAVESNFSLNSKHGFWPSYRSMFMYGTKNGIGDGSSNGYN